MKPDYVARAAAGTTVAQPRLGVTGERLSGVIMKWAQTVNLIPTLAGFLDMFAEVRLEIDMLR